MNQQSRRVFLKYTSLGAVAVGAGAAAPAVVSSAASAGPQAAQQGRSHDGPLVAYVADARSGDVAVMVGEREVVLHDPDLALRLGQLAASAR